MAKGEKNNFYFASVIDTKKHSSDVGRGNNESFMQSAQVVPEFQTEAAELTPASLLQASSPSRESARPACPRLPAASGGSRAAAKQAQGWKGR